MAITSGKITHGKGYWNSNVFGPNNFFGTEAKGSIVLSSDVSGYFEKSGFFESLPIDLSEVEASSLGKLSFTQGYLHNHPETLGLWYAKEGTGVTIKDLSGRGRDASLSSSAGWRTTGGFFHDSRYVVSDNTINLGGANLYAPSSGMTIDVVFFPEGSIQSIQHYTFEAKSNLIGIKCQYIRDNYNGWTRLFPEAFIQLEDGSTLTVTTPYISDPPTTGQVYATLRWTGTNLELIARPNWGQAVSGSSAATSLQASASAAGDFTIKGITNNGAGRSWIFNSARILPFAVNDQEFSRNIFTLSSNTRLFFQTQTAATSGAFGNDWRGPAGEDVSIVSDFNDLWSVSQLTPSALTVVNLQSIGATCNYPVVIDNNSGTTTGQIGHVTVPTMTMEIDLKQTYDFKVIRINRRHIATYSNSQVGMKVSVLEVHTGAYRTIISTQYQAIGVDGIVEYSLTSAMPFSRVKVEISRAAGDAFNTEVREIFLLGKNTSLGPLMAVGDLAVSSSSSKLIINGSDSSHGAYLPIRIDNPQVPIADFLQASMACSNPDALFKLNLHSASSTAAPVPTAASTWSYSFYVKSEDFEDIFFPDFKRTAFAFHSTNSYWLTLEVIDPAGGFELQIDKMTFKKGLTNGGQIQSAINSYIKYRAIFLTTN